MKFRILLVLLALVVPTVVNALGLGKLELQSALNQPFKARVELLSATADELDSLKVSLADQKAFERAGIQRTFLLTSLRFRVEETESGFDYIKILSSDPIREPFLNFLLEINWPKGRLFREYTVLLDPPTYTVSGSKKKAVIHPETPVVEIDSDDHQVVYDLEYNPESKTSLSQPTAVIYTGSGDYGPAVTGDTLWSIAGVARPDSSVSIQKMMLAILNANPEAFIENNINGLKRGAILQIPDPSEIDSMDQTDVLAQVNSQHALWDEYKEHVSTYVSQQPESSGGYSQPGEEPVAEEPVAEEPGDVEQEPSVTDVGDEGEAELRLISETDQGSGSNQSTAGASGVDVDALNNELALANESIEALSLENAELKDKLTETEGIIDDLKRLFVLKEDAFAAMQEQIMIAAAEQESAEAITDETIVEEDLVEEIEATTDEEPVEEEVEETLDEEELVVEDEEVLAEGAVIEEVVVADDEGMGALSGLKDQAMDMLEKAKANLKIVGGAIGGLLLLAFLMIFVSKRRSAKATVIESPAGDFPDFSEATDSESITVIPESEDETVLPGDDVAEAEPDVDAFEVLEDTADIPQESAPEIPEEDPMEEVNVFLAYEHFDEAESFVRKALEDDPDNLNFHSKLLEVFYAAGNKKSYEDAARVAHEKTDGQGEHWDAAVAMWQEMSPNRALFETPVAGEDEEAATVSTGGGVLNIAVGDDGSDDGAADMDFNIGAEGSEEEILDVTATADSVPAETESSESLDLDTSVDMDLSADESDELLDSTIEMDPSNVQKVQQTEEDGEDVLDISVAADSEDSSELDILFGDTSGEDGEDVLDISVAADSEDSSELDIAFGDTSGEDGEDVLDISVAADSEESSEFDIAFGDTSGEDGEDVLDISVAADSEESSELDISFGDTPGDDSGSLDDSSDLETPESSDELDISFGDGDTSGEGEEDLLDFSIAESSEDSKELDISSGDEAGDKEDLLDVTSAIDFESEDEGNLLDVTIIASEDDETDMGTGTSDKFDLDLGSESSEISLEDDLIGDVEDEADALMDMGDDSGDLDIGSVDVPEIDLDDGALDMDSTVEMSPASKEALGMADEDEDEDDDEKTFMVPRSSDINEQSEDEEMASQLDLAKAYIELGDNENAKTILDEIIAQGSENYRKQAEELVGQIK